jgi:hypothetical protein
VRLKEKLLATSNRVAYLIYPAKLIFLNASLSSTGWEALVSWPSSSPRFASVTPISFNLFDSSPRPPKLVGMSIDLMRKRLAADRASFVEPCLPSPADKPPSGSNWIHENQARRLPAHGPRDPVGIRLITRSGHDWSNRYPLLVEAVNHLKVRSCLIDGEVACAATRRAWLRSSCFATDATSPRLSSVFFALRFNRAVKYAERLSSPRT